MIGRPIERVLIAARGGEGMRLLKAVEASGREGVLLMREEDAHQAWIDEVAYAVHVPEDERGRWPDWDRVASAALDAGCDALLAGPGPLAAHAGLADRLVALNVLELGPGATTLALAADAVRLLDLARSVGLRTVPAVDLPRPPAQALGEARGWIDRWGPPLWVRVRDEQGWVETRRYGSSEAAMAGLSALAGTGQLTLLHHPPHARVVEVPLLGDGAGEVLALGDREITLARGGEGALVEAPTVDLPPALREALRQDAIRLGQAVRLRGTAALTFAVTADGRAFLRELRPGLQPWHAVTELVYGLDLVSSLIALAEGGALPCAQEDVVPDGAGIWARLVVEAAAPLPEHVAAEVGPRPEEEEDLPLDDDSLPIAWVQLPEDVQIDVAVVAGDRVRLGEELGALTVGAPTRQAAIVRAKSTLDHVDIGGVAHTGALLAEVLSDAAYWRGPTGADL